VKAQTAVNPLLGRPPQEKGVDGPTLRNEGEMRLKLVVEGWRSLSHSYAIVNQWQLLALAARPEIDLRVKDLPYYSLDWRAQPGLFPEPCDRIIQGIEPAAPDFTPDATWRIAFPFNLAPAATGRTLVHATAEHRVVPRSWLAANAGLQAALQAPSVTITTPSRWSAEGFRRLGFEAARIAVIPHGIDPGLFRPRPERRAAIRQQLGLSGFVFMSAGVMSGNKGMDVLLKAFAAVAEQRDDVRLLLKGADRLYPSRQLLQKAFGLLSPSQVSLVESRLTYGGAALSMVQMADFYQAGDCYVSPYRAEGFNMPVLEAAACGLPVICTSGGSTDDFTTDDFALRIDSRPYVHAIDGENGTALEPDLDHLIALMQRILDDEPFRSRAAAEGPRHAVEHYSWTRIVERVMPLLAAP
jgi:glycosyltransferase involved in cell wall biosynthesis